MATTLTGKTRYRSLQRGIWPFNSTKLVLQVEVHDQFTIVPDFQIGPETVHDQYHWRDAKLADLTISEARELFVRENPR